MALLSPEALAATLTPTGSSSLLARAYAPRTLDDCVIEGCYGLPAGLHTRCYDPANIRSYGPPLRYKSAGDALICALVAGGTEEGQRLIREAEARRTAARTAATQAQRSGAVPYQESRNRLIQLCRPRVAGWNVRMTKRKYEDATGWPGVAMFGTSYDVVSNPANMRCYIFQTEAFELQKNLARMLKQQMIARRETMGYLEAIDWAMQAVSCAAMTVSALNINPTQAWLHYVRLHHPTPVRQTATAAWPRFWPLYGFDYVQSYTLDEALLMSNWPGTVAGPTIAGESPSSPGGLVADITLPPWARRAGDAGSSGQAVSLWTEWINGADLASKREELRQRALNMINFRANLKDSVLVETEQWLDWVLSLPSYSTIMRGYTEEWVKSATTFDPSSPYGRTPPISAQDYKAVRDGTKSMNEALALAAIGGVATVVAGIGTLNPVVVIGGLTAIVGSFLVEAPRLSQTARAIQMPFTRWLSDPTYSLDAAGPDTGGMMARLVGSLVRYQNDLGIDFGITAEGGVPATPQTLPPVVLPPPPPPPQTGTSQFAKIALIGGAGLGALALVRYLMK